MRKFLSSRYLLFVSRFIVGIVFVVASVDKIAFPELFAVNVQAYGIVPLYLVNIVALILPWLELTTGLFLIAGVYVRSSSVIISFALGIFIVSIIVALFRGLKIDCGCFGHAHNTPIGWWRVCEDILLVLLNVHIYYCDPQEDKIRK